MGMTGAQYGGSSFQQPAAAPTRDSITTRLEGIGQNLLSCLNLLDQIDLVTGLPGVPPQPTKEERPAGIHGLTMSMGNTTTLMVTRLERVLEHLG